MFGLRVILYALILSFVPINGNLCGRSIYWSSDVTKHLDVINKTCSSTSCDECSCALKDIVIGEMQDNFNKANSTIIYQLCGDIAYEIDSCLYIFANEVLTYWMMYHMTPKNSCTVYDKGAPCASDNSTTEWTQKVCGGAIQTTPTTPTTPTVPIAPPISSGTTISKMFSMWMVFAGIIWIM